MSRRLSPLLLPVAMLAASLGLGGGALVTRAAQAQGQDRYEGLATLARVMAQIEARHVSSPSSSQLIASAIRGMAGDLDPHSSWMEPQQWEQLQESTEGRWSGVGLITGLDGQDDVVKRALEGGPAWLAGVRRGDRIVRIDGQEVEGLGSEELRALFGGERGQALRLEVLRGEEVLVLSVVRDQVFAPSVELARLDERHAYARISQFQRRTSAELVHGLARLEREGGPIEGLVLDLRDNPGGLMDEAVEVVDLFIGEGAIVETRDRSGAVTEAHRGSPQVTDRAIPLVVLINGSSASAAEVVAGAMQDLGRARVVGTPSYGKGSVQMVSVFEDGSALRLTVARYHLPGGRTLEPGDGVQPDSLVRLATDASRARERVEAVRLALPPAQAEQLGRDLEQLLAPEGTLPEPPIDWDLPVEERALSDLQVQAAWELLRSGS